MVLLRSLLLTSSDDFELTVAASPPVSDKSTFSLEMSMRMPGGWFAYPGTAPSLSVKIERIRYNSDSFYKYRSTIDSPTDGVIVGSPSDLPSWASARELLCEFCESDRAASSPACVDNVGNSVDGWEIPGKCKIPGSCEIPGMLAAMEPKSGRPGICTMPGN